ncbi:MAG: hypothetical protein COB66_08215 [Coxiella sp. (in: Bacteria)]|nr:MAG: hypothetical protein COB66_08215 [Coxiella sp. (in: g-proteobacteria)]
MFRESTPIEMLPEELLFMVLRLLDVIDLLTAMNINRRWHASADSGQQKLWLRAGATLGLYLQKDKTPRAQVVNHLHALVRNGHPPAEVRALVRATYGHTPTRRTIEAVELHVLFGLFTLRCNQHLVPKPSAIPVPQQIDRALLQAKVQQLLAGPSLTPQRLTNLHRLIHSVSVIYLTVDPLNIMTAMKTNLRALTGAGAWHLCLISPTGMIALVSSSQLPSMLHRSPNIAGDSALLQHVLTPSPGLGIKSLFTPRILDALINVDDLAYYTLWKLIFTDPLCLDAALDCLTSTDRPALSAALITRLYYLLLHSLSDLFTPLQSRLMACLIKRQLIPNMFGLANVLSAESYHLPPKLITWAQTQLEGITSDAPAWSYIYTLLQVTFIRPLAERNQQLSRLCDDLDPQSCLVNPSAIPDDVRAHLVTLSDMGNAPISVLHSAQYVIEIIFYVLRNDPEFIPWVRPLIQRCFAKSAEHTALMLTQTVFISAIDFVLIVTQSAEDIRAAELSDDTTAALMERLLAAVNEEMPLETIVSALQVAFEFFKTQPDAVMTPTRQTLVQEILHTVKQKVNECRAEKARAAWAIVAPTLTWLAWLNSLAAQSILFVDTKNNLINYCLNGIDQETNFHVTRIWLAVLYFRGGHHDGLPNGALYEHHTKRLARCAEQHPTTTDVHYDGVYGEYLISLHMMLVYCEHAQTPLIPAEQTAYSINMIDKLFRILNQIHNSNDTIAEQSIKLRQITQKVASSDENTRTHIANWFINAGTVAEIVKQLTTSPELLLPLCLFLYELSPHISGILEYYKSNLLLNFPLDFHQAAHKISCLGDKQEQWIRALLSPREFAQLSALFAAPLEPQPAPLGARAHLSRGC